MSANRISNRKTVGLLMPGLASTPHNVNSESQHKLGLVRRFDFSSKLQRMSVIVKNFSNGTYKSFIKGSPEKIKEMCTPESLPENFDEI
jgi:cation-transporting ATPase 13A3/4/5